MENKGISNRMRNLMQKYIGKKYAINYHGRIIWTSTIISMMGNTGYFVTEINDGESTWNSNASYGEITKGIKKGQYIEL